MIKSEKPPGTRDPAATRRALLDAAADAFAKDGFEGARTRDISTRAGVNQALIRYHFGGKEGLYAAVILDAVDTAREPLTALRASPDPPAERLRHFITVFSQMVERRPHSLTLLLREYLSGARRLSPEVMAQVGEFFATSSQIVRQGIRSGDFRRVDPHALHLSLVGSIAFYFATQPWREVAAARGELPARAPTTRAYVHHLQDLILDGIRHRTAKPKSRRTS
jgi:TetR/AcrR family transcriptional regulator